MMGAANGPNFLTRVDASRDRDALLASLVQRVATRVEADPQRSRAFILILSIRKRDLR